MKYRFVIGCLLPALACAATAVADEPAKAHAARFYAAGLEVPLLELRRGAMLLATCTMRLRRACSKEQRQLAARNHTLALLDELTLFPQRPTDMNVKSAGDLKTGITAAGAALLRTAGDYDRLLIARYGAALQVCPGGGDPKQREALDALTAVDLRQFQELDGADFDAAIHEIADAEARAVETLRAMPAADCDAALTLGQLLMEMINGKLEPWTHVEKRMASAYRPYDFDAALKTPPDTPTRDVAISVAGNFVTLVATELQLTVFPETAPRIKAIAETEGIHEAG